jgi:hypothetical protein
MRGAWLAVMLLPLAASADTSVRDPASDCLVVVRRALAADYPNDEPDERYCARGDGGELACRGDCDDRSCHNDACERYTMDMYVSIERVGGRSVPHVWGYAMSTGDFARQYGADLRRQMARARRVLARCLAQ